jgi:hypothetical protein
MFFAALLDRLKHCPAHKVVSRLDIDRYDTTFVFSFELWFQLCPIDRFRFPIEGQRITVLHVNSVYFVRYHFGSLTRRPATGREKTGATRRSHPVAPEDRLFEEAATVEAPGLGYLRA